MIQIALPGNKYLVCPYFENNSDSITYSENEEYVFSLDKKNRIIIWDKNSFLPVKILNRRRKILSISACSNAPELLIVRESNKIEVFNYHTCTSRFIKAYERLTKGIFLPLKQYFLVTGKSQYIYLINGEKNEYITKFKKPTSSETLLVRTSKDSNYFCVVEQILSFVTEADFDSEIIEVICYDLRTNRIVQRIESKASDKNKIEDVNLYGNNLLVYYEDHLETINLDSGKTSEKLHLHKEYGKAFLKMHDDYNYKIFNQHNKFKGTDDFEYYGVTKKEIYLDTNLGCPAVYNQTEGSADYRGIKPALYKKIRTRQFRFAPNGEFLLAYFYRKNILNLNLENFDAKPVDYVFKNYSDVIISPDSKYFAVQNKEFDELLIFETETNSLKFTRTFDECYIPLAFTPDSQNFILLKSDSLFIYDIVAKKIISEINLDAEKYCEPRYGENLVFIDADNFIYTPNNFYEKYHISGKNIYKRDLCIDGKDEEDDDNFLFNELDIICCTLSNCNQYAYMGTIMGYVAKVDIKSGHLVKLEKILDDEVAKLFPLDDGLRILASDYTKHKLVVIDSRTLEILGEIVLNKFDVDNITYSPNKTHIIVQEREFSYDANSGLNICTFLDSETLEKTATLMFNDLDDFGLFLADGRYEVTKKFMEDNYLTQELKILRENENLINGSTANLLKDFIKL